MSTEYAGIPTVARRFWYVYSLAVISGVASFIFTGSFAAVLVLLFAPDAASLFLVASVSYILHSAALFVSDIRTGDYEPSQSSYSTPKELLAIIVVMGTYQSTVLLIGVGGGMLAQSMLGTSTAIATVIAAYYPVADMVLMRRGWMTPGSIAALVVVMIVDTLINIHKSVVDTIPVIGRNRRLQR